MHFTYGIYRYTTNTHRQFYNIAEKRKFPTKKNASHFVQIEVSVTIMAMSTGKNCLQ